MASTEQNHIQITLALHEVATIMGALSHTGSTHCFGNDLRGTWVLPIDAENILTHLGEVLCDQNAMKPEIMDFIRDLEDGKHVTSVNASYKELI